jgi:predicted dehydrogenase
MKTLKVGMIGYKFMGKTHSNAWRQVDKFFPVSAKPELHTICGRDKKGVTAAAKQLGWSHVSTRWQDVVANPEIDVLDINTANDTHAEISIAAAKAGKHVLCEKPMAVTSGECQEMIDAGKNASRKLMIAYRLRYEPYNQSAIEMARRQAYGKIKVFESENIQNVFPPNIRLSKKTGGGPLGDVGVYCINAARYITGEPTDVPRFAEVPESVIWTMRFPSGVLAHCSCGFGGEESRRYRVHCAEGWFELDPAFSYRGLRLHVKKGNEREEITLPEKSHFALEMDHFSQCVLEDRKPWTPGEEGLADIRVIEAIERSIQSGRPEKAQARLAARG